MAIDTNIGIMYNENFPVSGVDQPSQGFRDNFSVLKRAIENLQAATATAGSIFNIASSIGAGGEVRVAMTFKNNAFVLPTGAPTIPAAIGMFRHQNGAAQIHDGTAWRTLLNTDATGGIQFGNASYLKLPVGPTSERPSPASDGMIRFNTTTAQVELYRLGSWSGISGDDGINATGGTISGFLNLLSDAVNPTHAVNLRALRYFMGNAFVSSPTPHGINAQFNYSTNTVQFAAQPFNIQLAGQVTGNGVVTNLGNVVINTEIPEMLTLRDVRDEVGQFVKGTVRQPNNPIETETGITVNYDPTNNTLELGVREFDIVLTGAVTGTGHSSRLGNVTINTTTDLIKGLQAFQDGTALGGLQSVREIEFIGNAADISQTGSRLSVEVKAGLTQKDIRDTVGTMVSGTIRDPNDLTYTETGIYVNYDAANNRLELAPRDFTVTLTGAVTGSATISRLNNATITTTTNLIRGLNVQDEGVPTGMPQSVRTMNFVGNAISVAQVGNVATISINDGLSPQNVRDLVGSFVRGTSVGNANTFTETGIIVNYDANNNVLELGVKDFTIDLEGAVVGSATISRLGNAVINTTTDLIRGIQVMDEGVDLGYAQSVKRLNFIGNAVSATQVGDTVNVSVAQGLTPTNVRDTVGSFLVGTVRQNNNSVTESGITFNYDQSNNVLEVGVRSFEIALTGAVRGNAVVSRLNNVAINTTTDLIRGIQVANEGVYTGYEQTVKELNFVGGGVDVTQTGNTVTVLVPAGVTDGDIRDLVGNFVVGTQSGIGNATTETGITVFYDPDNRVLELGVKDFDIELTGDVVGIATVSRLGNVAIQTSTNAMQGIQIADEGVQTGAPIVRSLNFIGGGVVASQTGNAATIYIPASITTTDVRNTVGTFIQGTIRDPNSQQSSESGIFVNYDSQNNVLEVSPRSFAINLTGAVTGSATVSRLNNVTITTSADFIKGVNVTKNNILLANNAKKFNFINGNVSVTGDTVNIDVSTPISIQTIRDTIVSTLVGDQHRGLSLSYDSGNAEIDIAAAPIEINLIGGVVGNGTVTYANGTSGSVTISTHVDNAGIEVKDEGTVEGTRVRTVNFVGGGITTTVSYDGQVATVHVPNSPANERFLLVGDGSANVPNARRLVPGTGILINDSGPGGDYTISAHNDAIVAKSRIMFNNQLVAERSQINIESTQEIFPEVTYDATEVTIKFYSLSDGWHRQPTVDMGTIEDRYGPSIDLGDLKSGIIEADADFGYLED